MRVTVIAALAAVAAAATPGHNYVDGQCASNQAQGVDNFPDKCESGRQFTETVDADYSLLWQVSYHETYKIVTNDVATETAPAHVVLYQCGTTPPDASALPAYAAGARFMAVPATGVGTTSTTYLPLIEMVGERNSLKAYGSTFDYVTSPCLRRLFLAGEIEENVATAARYDELGVDALFATQWGGDAVNADSFVEMSDIREKMPNAVLKTAEYVEYVGLFFNREQEAAAAIKYIVDNWLCSKDVVAEIVEEREPAKVAWLSYYAWGAGNGPVADISGGWNVPSTGTWVEEIIEAAGGKMIIPDITPERTGPWGFSYLSDAQVLEAFAEADVVLFIGAWDATAEPFVSVQELPAVKNGRLFDNQGPRGSYDWFERRVVSPDGVLQDFALAFFPEEAALAGLEHRWLRDVATMAPGARVPDSELEAACPDVNARYVFESTPMCKHAGGGSKKKKKSGASFGTGAIIGVVCAAVFFVALLACALVMGRSKAAPPQEGIKVVDDDDVEVKKLEA
jgi:hypothetical protein